MISLDCLLSNEVSAPSPSKMTGPTTGLQTMSMDSRRMPRTNLILELVHEVATQMHKTIN